MGFEDFETGGTPSIPPSRVAGGVRNSMILSMNPYLYLLYLPVERERQR